MAAHKNCEIITNDFIDLPSSSDSSSDDSDYDDMLTGSSHSTSQYSSSAKSTESKRKSIQRLPTRKPDPNVSNRNALLARENRRKKKEYVETLEKELSSIKSANKKLHKTLRKHMKLVKKLEHEKQYYKGLISNKTDILNLVSALNDKITPMGGFSPKQSSCSPTDSNRSLSSLEQPLTYDFDDNDSNYEGFYDNNWNQLLGMDNDGALQEEVCGYFPNSNLDGVTQLSNVKGEHNYSNSHLPVSGVCLHIAEGSFSTENFDRCQLNIKRSSPLPDQLLLVD